MNRYRLLLTVSVLFIQFCFAQEESNEAALQLEQWVEQQEMEPELDDLHFNQEQLENRRISITQLQPEQMTLLGLKPVQIQSFQWYTKQFGKLADKYELQALPFWDRATIEKVLPFIEFAEDQLPGLAGGHWYKEGTHQLMFRTSRVLEKSRGYMPDSLGNTKYEGSPQRLHLRYNFQYEKNLWMGITMEKDAGEVFGTSVSRPADFTSVHFLVKGAKWIKQLALGDYSINLGQGLTVWQGMAFGKGSEGAGVFRQGQILKTYRSADEFNFFRGAAIHVGKGKWESLVWVSVRKKSARLQYMGDDAVAFTSFSETGYHRTSLEIEGRKKVQETVMGTTVRWQGKNLRVGWNGIYQRFSLPWLPEPQIYNQFYFRGRQANQQSVDYSFSKKQWFLFGELCRSSNNAWALVQGLLLTVNKNIDATVVYRFAQPGFHSYYANAMTEQSAVRNEEGVYNSWQIRFNRGWKAQLFSDFFRFPWLRFRVDAPSAGHEARVLVQWERRRQWLVYGFIKTQSKMENAAGSVTNEITAISRQQLRMHVERIWTKEWLQSVRLEKIWFQKGENIASGWGAYADMKYQFPQKGWHLTGRIQVFQTDNYSTRIYAYERDLLYSFSVPSVYDHGWRYYFQWYGRLAQKSTGKLGVKWWLRWSQTIHTNKQSSGSGWDEILGNRRSEWKFQLLFDW